MGLPTLSPPALCNLPLVRLVWILFAFGGNNSIWLHAEERSRLGIKRASCCAAWMTERNAQVKF